MAKWGNNDLYGDWDDGLQQPASNADLIPLVVTLAVVTASVAVAAFVASLRLVRALRTGRVIAGGLND